MVTALLHTLLMPEEKDFSHEIADHALLLAQLSCCRERGQVGFCGTISVGRNKVSPTSNYGS